MRANCTVKILPALALLAAAAAVPAVYADSTAPAVPAAPELGVWQHHAATIQYFATTTRYSCDGVEDKVRQILGFLGARKDISVVAQGCDRGPFRPSHMATVKVEFYSLAPAGDAHAADGVAAHWRAVDMRPQQARFLSGDDCDLLKAMQSALTTSFSWHNLKYGTSCFPYSETSNSYAVKGAVLAPDEPPKSG